VDRMCNELIDEARRDDPIKHAAYAAKQQFGGGHTDQNNRHKGQGRDQGRGGGSGHGGTHNGDHLQLYHGQQQQGNQPSNHKRPEKVHCKHCGFVHYGGGNNCWYTFPQKATEDWRRKNADKLRNKKWNGTAAIAVQSTLDDIEQSYQHLNFSTTTSVINISDQVRSLAGRDEYQKRLILDTGATDHLCNDYSKFINFNNGTYYAVINTGAGPMTVSRKGTIKVTVVCSDGSLQPVTFSNV
ncbi:hypothetical protein EJ02DRAFT_308366, partial [Clathrospora elynae]